MTESMPRGARFPGLIDLARARLGARALSSTDDFFASVDNLVRDEEPIFDPHRFTENGKWMDGWESRRKRQSGHDWAVVELGAPGVIRALDIDTAYFLGNHPPFASMEAARLSPGEPVEHAEWVQILPEAPLAPGAQNLFTVRDETPFTHVRLHIYPDGGVARLRVYGEVAPSFEPTSPDALAKPHLTHGEVDLAAVVNGGLALTCSDAFFAPMNNLLMPGRPEHMGGGWETRRRRTPGYDWILLRLGAVGTLSVLELDTCHFKGNFPSEAAVEGILAPGARTTELSSPDAPFVKVLPRAALAAHERHFFADLDERGPFSHLKLSIFPDGGVARFRAWGFREVSP